MGTLNALASVQSRNRLDKESMTDTLNARLGRLMKRLEQTIPFPYNVEEFYASLFPAGFLDVAGVRAPNVLSVVSVGTAAAVMIERNRFFRCTFRTPLPVPMGSVRSADSGIVFCAPDEDVTKWWETASAFEVKIVEAYSIATMAIESEALHAWPGLQRALGVRKPKPNTPRAQKELRRLFSAPSVPIAQIDDLLATAVLLPDVKPPHAWVGILER